MRCVLHACISYVFIGTLARRKKTILGKLAIKIRVRHDTSHSLNITSGHPMNSWKRGGTEAVGSTIEKCSSGGSLKA